MRLLLVGGQRPEIAAAASLAAASGASVRHVATLDVALGELRAGRSANLLMLDATDRIDRAVARLQAERLFLPIVAYAVDCTPGQAAAAIKAGAVEFLPFPPEAELIAAILAAAGRERDDLICADPRMAEVLARARRYATAEACVLITGESGTGKEMVARLVHDYSKRARGPFVAVNCAAIPEHLLESELFGHERGAFTGAVARRVGRFEEANGGTLLLDEISEMEPRLQAKLLRAIQEREIDRVGGTRAVPVDLRLIATSNRDLERAVAEGSFRADLLFRLNVLAIRLPPLRERPLDVEALARHFATRLAHLNGIPDRPLSSGALARLRAMPWRGNVRELENCIHRAVVLAQGTAIESGDLELDPTSTLGESASSATGMVGRTMAEVERQMIVDTLRHTFGNRTHAATILGISIRTLRNKLRDYAEAGVPVPASAGADRGSLMTALVALKDAWPQLRFALRQGDVLLGIGVLAILVVLILPLPRLLLDLCLAISITLSVLILLTALFIEKPLEFSAFPIVLLIATILRLALNLASTRLILAHGHDGADAAGHVIEAFGRFIMQGSVVIGVIVFAILVIVNFVVITKGSGRIAEVAARFSLDAMPGKQMAIDADLSAGLIDEVAARERRRVLEAESAFFGAMDGAAKFVRGDAVAGLLITGINLVGGLLIGVVQQGVSLSEAAQTYTLLTIGDGLVSQIPGLITSTAAGLLVSKAGVSGRADVAVFGQLGAFPRALGVTAALMILLAILPGLPPLPFLVLGAAAGTLAWRAGPHRPDDIATTGASDAPAAGAEEPVTSALAMDAVRLELGYGLLGLIGEERGQRLPHQIRTLRRQLASELGFVMPSVRIQDNIQLPANTYVVRLKEIEAGRGDIRSSMLLAMDPQGRPITLPGESTTEPTFGLAATWIQPILRDEALALGLTAVDPATVITTHLTEIVRDNLADLLTYAETQKLLADLPPEYQKLLGELVPARITTAGIQRVLQGLLAERVSIRDLTRILEAIAEALGVTQSTALITEHVRARLARQISTACTAEGGFIPLLALSPDWEQAFAGAVVGQGDERQLAMAPSELQRFVRELQDALEAHAMRGELPALVTTPGIRPFVRSVVERVRPTTTVLSHHEIHPKARVRTLGQI